MGAVLTGKVSWFGGPHDATTGQTTASGASVARPGIAVYNRATLGGYWRVTFPNGRVAVLQQTDIGPAPFTGRKIDVTYSALHALGYSESNFPTDSQVTAEYLGKKGQTSFSQGAASSPSSSSSGDGGIFGAHQKQQAMSALLWVAFVIGGAVLVWVGLARSAGISASAPLKAAAVAVPK